MKILNKVPNRGISRFTGLLSSVPMYIYTLLWIVLYQWDNKSFIHSLNISKQMNQKLSIFLYLYIFRKPLTEYRTLNDIFSRGLKPGSRPVCEDSNAMCSPVDGRVLYIGKVYILNYIHIYYIYLYSLIQE